MKNTLAGKKGVTSDLYGNGILQQTIQWSYEWPGYWELRRLILLALKITNVSVRTYDRDTGLLCAVGRQPRQSE